MEDDLQERLEQLHEPVDEVMQSFTNRLTEPHINDNIYNAVVKCIRDIDPTLLDHLCPDIVLEHLGHEVLFKIYYCRVH